MWPSPARLYLWVLPAATQIKSVILHTNSQLGPWEAVTCISLLPIYGRFAFQGIRSLVLLPSRYVQIAFIYLREQYPFAVSVFVWPLRQSIGETVPLQSWDLHADWKPPTPEQELFSWAIRSAVSPSNLSTLFVEFAQQWFHSIPVKKT